MKNLLSFFFSFLSTFLIFSLLPPKELRASVFLLWRGHHQTDLQQADLLPELLHLPKEETSGLLSCESTQKCSSFGAGAVLTLQGTCSDSVPCTPHPKVLSSTSQRTSISGGVGKTWVTCFLEARPGPVPHGAHESGMVCYTRHPHHQPHIPLKPVSVSHSAVLRICTSCVYRHLRAVLGRSRAERARPSCQVKQCPIYTHGPAVHLSVATDLPNSNTLPGIPLTLTRPGPQGARTRGTRRRSAQTRTCTPVLS